MPIEEFSSGDIFVVQAFITDLNWQFTMLFWAVFMLFETSISITVSFSEDLAYFEGHNVTSHIRMQHLTAYLSDLKSY